MKSNPNLIGYPNRLGTGPVAGHRDRIEAGPVSGSVVDDGPPSGLHEHRAGDDDGPVTLATFPNGHEAHMARAAIESHGIDAFVHLEHCQYVSASSWVHLEVHRRDCELADAILERGPLGAPAGDANSQTDDLRDPRLQRRLGLARWFLYAQALALFPLTFFLAPLFVAPAGLALWSRSRPRRAFGVALGVQVGATMLTVAASGPSGFTSLIPLLAFYFAWAASVPNPPEEFLATPFPATPTIDIGDAWKVPTIEPPGQPPGLLQLLRIAVPVIFLIWVGWLAIRAAVT